MLQGAKESKAIICPRCKNEDTLVGIFKDKGWIKHCNAKDCGYEEVIKIDAWEENL